MRIPNPPYDGSCLCGAVRLRLTALPLLTLACHCRDCQKLSASAYTLSAMFPSDSFSYQGALVDGGLRSEGRTHYYCRSCLTFVYSQLTRAPERVNLRISVLAEADLFEPFAEVMVEEKLPWVQLPVARSFAAYPETPEAFVALLGEYADYLEVR
ncbi:MAG: GFA family protein [Pseudomonadota bacterium]